MINPFEYQFFLNAILSGTMLSIIAPLIGVFLLLKKNSMLADTMSHIGLLGLTIGLIINIYPPLMAFIIGLLGLTLIRFLQSNNKLSGDTALSVLLTASLSLTLILMTLTKQNPTKLNQFLFGNILAITTNDLIYLTIVILASFLLILKLWPYFLATTFDEPTAKSAGINTKQINTILTLLTGLILSITINIMGALLSGAILILPIISAFQISKNLKSSLFISILIGTLSIFIGLFTSFYFPISSTGSIVTANLIFFILSFILKPLFYKHHKHH